MNVLLIVVDTLRADHLGCYGYARATSPNVDALAAEGVLCERAFAPAIPTHPAFATLETGQYSVTHGVVAHGGARAVPRSAPWLAEALQTHGYTTCAVDNLGESRLGFGRGYEFYIDPTQKRALHINADNRTINSRVIPWLERYGGERFFLLAHYWDPHTPYWPPRAYRTLFCGGDPCDPQNRSLEAMDAHPLGKTWRETWFTKLGGHVTSGDYVEGLYDGEIRYCDDGIGRLLGALDRLGLTDDTLVVLTSDHGELMYRHGVFFDHHGLYDGNLHVPLIFRHPGLAPRRLPQLVEHVDVAPTILDLCGFAVLETMEGKSLAPLLRGETDAPVRDCVISQECTWQMKWAIRTDTHKFILAREQDFYGTPMRELYDLRTDPNERHNIVEQDPATARALEERLEGWLAEKTGAAYPTVRGRTLGQDHDPLVAHGVTLGRAWKKRGGAGTDHEPK